MKSAIAAVIAVTAGLAIANMLGVAAAEAPTGTTPPRTVSVDGVAIVPIPQGASLAVATSVYREGMAAAMADGQNKAEFLASKAGATLASVQSIVEGGGSIACTGGEEESGYVEYQGQEPDFASSQAVVSPVEAPRGAASTSTPSVKRKKKKKKGSAKAAAVTACTLRTDISLVYPIA